MQPGEKALIVEPRDLGKGVFKEIDHGADLPLVAGEKRSPIRALAPVSAGEEPAFQASPFIGGRQPCQAQSILGFEGGSRSLERVTPLLLHQPGRRDLEAAFRPDVRPPAASFDMQAPAAPKPLQRIVHARPNSHQLVLGGGFQVGPAEADPAQEGAVLVQDHAGSDEGGPRKMVGQLRRTPAMFIQESHGGPRRRKRRGA